MWMRKNKKLRNGSLSGLSSCLSLCLSRMIQAPVLCYVSHRNQRGKNNRREESLGGSEEFHFNVNEREMIQNKSAEMKWQRGGGSRLGEPSSAASRRLVCFVFWPLTKITRQTSDKDKKNPKQQIVSGGMKGGHGGGQARLAGSVGGRGR